LPIIGNCLFNALSDQIYGDQTSHAAIRTQVICYMRDHAAYYKQFIDVNPGGGTRRNPKRKNAGAFNSPANIATPSEADIDKVFEGHLDVMARGGTYGDNMEITAFSSAFGVDVKIYQRDFAYMVSGAGSYGDQTDRPVAHIAYHMWEHYSSIRNLDGPHVGLPKVTPKVLSPEEELKQKQKLDATPYVQPWQIDVVSNCLPFLADKPTIKRALEASKGNIDAAVSNLMDAEENGSGSSAQESSSVERDQDSDDDSNTGPNKKQDRRISRAVKKSKPRSSQTKHALSQLETAEGSQDSFTSSNGDDSEASTIPNCSQTSDTTTQSTSTAPSRPPIRLKLRPPKPPPDYIPPEQSGKTSQSQPGPRVSARDKKDIKKQAQKAARKERERANSKQASEPEITDATTAAGLALRQNGVTQTPPLETLRTLYI
jgi:OTU domain-containing protein 3